MTSVTNHWTAQVQPERVVFDKKRLWPSPDMGLLFRQ